MNIKVQFFGKFTRLAGTSDELVYQKQGAKLSDLLTSLSTRHGAVFAEELKNTSGLRIVVNGREYQVLSGASTGLQDGDTVVVLPLIEGG
jgi:MoaD family protein